MVRLARQKKVRSSPDARRGYVFLSRQVRDASQSERLFGLSQPIASRGWAGSALPASSVEPPAGLSTAQRHIFMICPAMQGVFLCFSGRKAAASRRQPPREENTCACQGGVGPFCEHGVCGERPPKVLPCGTEVTGRTWRQPGGQVCLRSDGEAIVAWSLDKHPRADSLRELSTLSVVNWALKTLRCFRLTHNTFLSRHL